MNQRILTGLLLAATLALHFACARHEYVERDRPPAEIAPAADPWSEFQQSIKDTSGLQRINELCRAWNDFESPERRTEIEWMYNEAVFAWLAEELAGRLAQDSPSTTVAVLNFTAVGGYPSLEGEEWSERLATALVRGGRLRVVERNRIMKILNEQKFASSDFIDDQDRETMGRLSGAGVLIMGTLGTQLHVKSVDVATGIVTYAEYVNRPYYKPHAKKADVLWEEVQSVEREQNPLGLKIWTQNRTYRLGDKVQFYCQAQADCYITLVAVRRDGTLTQLLPNPFSETNWVHRGETVQIPPAGADFWIEATLPSGPQRVIAYASLEPLQFIPRVSKQEFLALDNPDSAMQLHRDLELHLSRLPKDSWAEASWIFEIEE